MSNAPETTPPNDELSAEESDKTPDEVSSIHKLEDLETLEETADKTIDKLQEEVEKATQAAQKDTESQKPPLSIPSPTVLGMDSTAPGGIVITLPDIAAGLSKLKPRKLPEFPQKEKKK